MGGLISSFKNVGQNLLKITEKNKTNIPIVEAKTEAKETNHLEIIKTNISIAAKFNAQDNDITPTTFFPAFFKVFKKSALCFPIKTKLIKTVPM